MSTCDIKDIATIAGVVIAAGSLAFAAYNTRLSTLANRAKFWLDLRDQFSKHDEVHRCLRPGGIWASGNGPQAAEDWALLEAYMGLFEHCEIMIAKGLIDEKTFREIYAYRLTNIVGNEIIRREKLEERASGWRHFLSLLKRFDISMPK